MSSNGTVVEKRKESAADRYARRRAEMSRKIQSKVDVGAEARAERDDKELDAVMMALEALDPPPADPDDHLIRTHAPPHVLGHVVLERPSRVVFDRYRQAILRSARSDTKGAENTVLRARRDLILACLAFPQKGEEGAKKFAELEEELPGILEDASAKITKLAHTSAEEEAKK